MGPDQQQRLSPAERSNLVAYLDGELNEAESRAIATKLTQSITGRREIEALQKTWEMLDQLPMPRASESLTQRTLTEVGRLSLPGEKLANAAAKTVRHAVRMFAWTLLSLFCFVLGLVITRWVWPDPTARLARDLSIAEHLDEYRDVKSLDFLEGLDGIPEFANE
jgi:hypothetical protein